MERINEPTQGSPLRPLLQVLICTYGREGLERVAAADHPKVEGVEYLVSCQIDQYSVHSPEPSSLHRTDFKIFTSLTSGLSVNRNIALSQASAPLLLISDDDTDYTADGLRAVIESFAENPDSDLLAFRYDSSKFPKFYPDSPVSLNKCPKGYYVSSIEIAMRRASVQGKIWFNENFGIGAPFPAGEEDIFLRDCLDRGLKGTFIPKTIARHDGTTTGDRNLMLPSRPFTKGAVFLHLYPCQWPLRMLVLALREIPLWRKGIVPSPLDFCRNWLKGVREARKMKILPTPDYSIYYPCNERSEQLH